MDGNIDFEQYSFMGKEPKVFSPRKHNRKVKPKQREFIGWGSKSLRDFLKSIGKDSENPISQNEANSIIQKYILENKLTHPEKKKKVMCDANLFAIFGRRSVNRNKTYDLLERHFAENMELSEDDDWSCHSDEKDNGSTVPCKRQRRTNVSSKPDEKEKVTETPKSCFASVTAKNIKLVYLKRSLIEDLLKNPDTFDDKVMGSFVRVKSDPNDYFQKNSYQLLQITGLTKAHGGANIKEEVVLHVSNMKKDFHISMLSDEDFSEEEVEDLHQRIKDGMLKKLTIVELEQKAISLHEDLTRHWIKRELVRLQNLSDRANEKGWRRELFEYMETLQLLKTPAEQQRLIQEVPKVIAEEIEVKVTSLDSPEDGSLVMDDSPRPILLPRDSVTVDDIAGTGRAFSVNTVVEVTSNVSVTEVNVDDTDNKAAGKVAEGSGATFVTSKKDEIAVSVVVTDSREIEHATNCTSILPILDGNGDRRMDTFDDKGKGDASFKVLEHDDHGKQLSSIQVKVGNSGETTQVVALDDKKGCHGTVNRERSDAVLINLDDSDDDETPDSKIWHYMDPNFGETHGPFEMLALKAWWDDRYFDPEFKVWKSGQTKEQAILLKDVLIRMFPEYYI